MLQAVVALHPPAPYSSLSLAYLRLGEAYDRLGVRTCRGRRVSRRDRGRCRHRILHKVRSQSNERLRARAGCEARGGVPAVRSKAWRRLEHNDIAGGRHRARDLACAERIGSGCPLSLRARAAGAQGRRRRRSPNSSTRFAARIRARRPSSATPTSRPRASSSASAVARRRSPTITSRRRSSAPQPTRAPRRLARSRDSSGSDIVERCCDCCSTIC